MTPYHAEYRYPERERNNAMPRRRRECLGSLIFAATSIGVCHRSSSSAAAAAAAAFVAPGYPRPSHPFLPPPHRLRTTVDQQLHQRIHTTHYALSDDTAIQSSKAPTSGTLCIKFSRCYQRFLAYRPKRGRGSDANKSALNGINISGLESDANATVSANGRLFCRFDDECQEVVESFVFLDEAFEKYPNARLVRLSEVADMHDIDDCNQVIPGMGNISSSTAARIILDPNNTNIGRTIADAVESSTGIAEKEIVYQDISKQGRKSLHYLSSLTASLVADATKEKSDTEALREDISSTLLDRIGLKRFMSHTPQSLQLNYQRLLDLFTRSRPFRQKAVHDDGKLNEIIGSGLSFSESAARGIISYFPELILYDFHEVEERIRFMLAPLPPTNIISSLNDSPSSKRKRPGRPRGTAATDTKTVETDWARLSWEGYGAGLTIEQATDAVRAIPNILSLRHTDSKKPSALYYIKELQVSTNLSILAENNLEKYLMGTERSDVWAYAYLNKIGLQWNQLRILLDAFPTLTCIGTDVDWRLLNRGLIRDRLDEFALMFLRKRLQIGTMDVFTMLKTHSRLSYYKMHHMIPKLDVYQSRLGLSSRELRKVILRMPSLLGMSVYNNESDTKSSVDERLEFFYDEVGMAQEELKQALLKQPSLLQYSVVSLRSKLSFLRDELFISRPVVSRIISTAPAILGLSLSENIRPKVATLMVRCRFSPEEIGFIVARVPSILALSTKRKIEPCLSYLSVALRLPDEASLGGIIKSAPRILVQSISSSLDPKIRMMDEALEQERLEKGLSADDEHLKVMDLCMKNPALLATTNAILGKRISACHNNTDTTLSEALKPSTKGRKQKFEIVRGHVRAVGEDITEERQGLTGAEGYGYTSDMADAIASLVSSGPSLNDLASANIRNSTALSITAFISGQVFPPDSDGNVRGISQVGGMAIQIAQRLSARQLKIAAESSTTAVISEKEEPGSNFDTGLILLKFPHLRASRHRCDLCACELALKIILNFLKESAASYDLSNFNVRVEICSDSFYVYKMVQNRDNLLRWGSYPSLENFVYEGSGPKSLANPDILYPLSQYVVDLTSCRSRNDDICIGKSVNVVFKHTSEVCSGLVSELTTRQMNEYARQAAMWAYDRDRKKGVGV